MKLGTILALILTMTTGCATFVTRVGVPGKVCENANAGRAPYPAVCLDGEILRSTACDSRDTPRITTARMLALSFGVMLDAPFSFAFDTICLPYDLWQYGRERKREVKDK
jgi:uncharacterized protein YceK